MLGITYSITLNQYYHYHYDYYDYWLMMTVIVIYGLNKMRVTCLSLYV